MDIGRSFTYMFDDEDWLKKIAVGTVLNSSGLAGLIASGYGLRTLRNVAEGVDAPLPEWDDTWGDLVKGFTVAVARLIAWLPLFVIWALGLGLGALGGSDPGVASVCAAGVSCLAVLWILAVVVYFPAAVIRYTAEGEFRSFFEFKKVFRFIGDNLSSYVVVILLAALAWVVAVFVGMAVVGIGLLVTTFWATLVSSHLMGQLQAQAATAAGPGGFATTDLSSEEGES